MEVYIKNNDIWGEDVDDLTQSMFDEIEELEKKIDNLTTQLVSYEVTIDYLKDTLQEIANEDFRGNRPSGAVKAFKALEGLKT